MTRNALIAASIAALALTASQPAFAGTRTVSYADLDLSTSDGQSRLDTRLKQAAKNVCGVHIAAPTLIERGAAQRCFKKSLAQARLAKADILPMAYAAK